MNDIFSTKEAKALIKKAVNSAIEELDNTPRYLLDTSNPNHPNYDLHIFSEHHESFMSRQYKK